VNREQKLGIVHRDLKLSNRLVERRHVYVLDPRLAKENETDASRSRSGVVLGTPVSEAAGTGARTGRRLFQRAGSSVRARVDTGVHAGRNAHAILRESRSVRSPGPQNSCYWPLPQGHGGVGSPKSSLEVIIRRPLPQRAVRTRASGWTPPSPLPTSRRHHRDRVRGCCAGAWPPSSDRSETREAVGAKP